MPHLYTHADPARDADAMVRVLTHAFAGAADGVRDWMLKSGMQHFRLVREAQGAPPTATLLRVPMGQHWGGVSVPMVGIAGVGVAPEARGRGAARFVMTQALREIRAEGVPLSALYPATTTLYRRVGYENAGAHFEHQFPVGRIGVVRGAPRARPYAPADLPAVKECYTRFARNCDATLDRSDYIWERVLVPRANPCTGFVIEEPDEAARACGGTRITGYTFFRQERSPVTGRHDILSSDIVATTTRAAKGLLAFFADFSSMAEDLTFTAAAAHPLMPLIDEPRGLRIRFKDYWMLRIVDVAGALSARGYPPGLSAQLHLEITDETLPENGGRWLLHVEGGKGRVSRGGLGSLRCDIRGLASIYAGHLTPELIRTAGLADADDATLATARAVFAGNPMGCCDFF